MTRTSSLKMLTVIPALVLAMLAGCSAAPAPLPAEGPAATTQTETTATVSPECTAVSKDPQTEVDGRALGACMGAAMVLAQTGTMLVESPSTPSSTVQFKFDPLFSMTSRGSDAGDLVIREDAGWLRGPLTEGNWVREDPSSSDPIVAIATGVIGMMRVASDPRTLVEFMGLCPQWLSVGMTQVDGESAFQYHCQGSYDALGVTISEQTIWLDVNYLGVKSVGTGTLGDTSTVTTNTFSDWGQPVEIPDPSKAD